MDAAFDGNFTDIAGDAYYYKEIGIAKDLGITGGTGDDKFCPHESITKQDMITLTVRALGMLGVIKEQGPVSDLDTFTDKFLIADYALQGIATAVKEGLKEEKSQVVDMDKELSYNENTDRRYVV